MPSRSFYVQDDDITTSTIVEKKEVPVVENTKSQVKAQAQKEETLVTKYVDGFKIETSKFLEKHLHGVRTSIIDKVNYVDAEYRNLKSAANNEWNNLTADIRSVYDPRDDFVPSFICTLTAMLSGSIMVNQKSLPVRFLTPVLFGVAGFKVFLPRTFDNTMRVIKSWEAKEHPELLDAQRGVKQMVIESEKFVEKTSEDLNQGLINLVHDVRVSLTK